RQLLISLVEAQAATSSINKAARAGRTSAIKLSRSDGETRLGLQGGPSTMVHRRSARILMLPAHNKQHTRCCALAPRSPGRSMMITYQLPFILRGPIPMIVAHNAVGSN